MKTTTRSIVAKLLCPPLTTIAIVSFALQSASAETDTWSGGGDGTSWNQAANWSDNNSAAPVNGDSLVFGNVAGSTLNDNLGGALTTYGISFSQSGYTLNTGNASSIFLSGQSVGYETGIYNGSGGFNTVNLNLNLDWGYYTFADYSGNGFALNGTLTPNKGGVAYFYANGAPITSTSLTTDSSGLIAGLGGAGLMFNGASPNAAVPTGLATVSGGDIVAYTGWPSVVSTAGAIGATAAASAVNIELTGTAAGNYTLANGSGITYANTILLSAATANALVVGSTAGTQTLDVGAVSGVGGFYVIPSGTAQVLTVGSGSSTILTAGPESGPATPSAVIFGVNGPGGNVNSAEINCSIQNNGSGGPVSLIKMGTGSMFFNGALTTFANNTYTGGIYVDQGLLQIGNAGCVSTGPIYVASNATIYFNNAVTIPNTLYLSSGLGSPESVSIETTGTAGALAIASSSAYTFSGTMNLLGSPVTTGPGVRIGSTASTPTVNITGQITGTGTLEFFSAHSGTLTLANPNTSGPNTNNWQGGVILDPPPGHAVNETLKMGLNNQIPSGPNAGNVIMTPAETTVFARFELNGTSQTINGLFGYPSTTSTTSNVIGNAIASAASLTLGANNATASFTGYSADAGTLSITKIGTGTQTFTSTGSAYPFAYNGNTTISAGTLQLTQNATIPTTPLITVASVATLDASQLNAGGLTLGTTQTLAGHGTINGSTTIDGTVSSLLGTIGTLTNNGNLAMAGGGTYTWDINNATGAAGSDPGWSMLYVGGQLQLGSLSAGSFTINVTSLTSGDVAGNAANFNSGTSYSFPIAYAAGGISGFSSGLFKIVTSAFANYPGGASQWSVSLDNTGDYLMLNFDGFSVLTISLPATPVTINQNGSPPPTSATFTVTANSLGTSPSFAWTQEGQSLPAPSGTTVGGGSYTISTTGGGYTSTLTISGADQGPAWPSSTDSGVIGVTASETYSSATQTGSSAETLNVIDAPYNLNAMNVTQVTAPAPVATGGVNLLTASASGTAPFTYQWYLNGNLINGATSSSYNVNISPATLGNYTVNVANAAGNVTSTAISITGYNNNPVSLVPNQIVYEPFTSYAIQSTTQSSGNPWTAFGVTNIYNQATGVGLAWVSASGNSLGQEWTLLEDMRIEPGYEPEYVNYNPSANPPVYGDVYPWPYLAYDGLQSPSLGNTSPGEVQEMACNSGVTDVNLPLGTGGSLSSGTAYFSIIMHVDQGNNLATFDASPEADCGFGHGASTAGSGSFNTGIYFTESAGQYIPGVFKVTAASGVNPGVNGNWSPDKVYHCGEIVFAVVRLTFTNSLTTSNTCDLWLDPNPAYFGTNEANVPAPDVAGVAGGAPDIGSADFFYIRSDNTPSSRRFTDLRIGTTWASVTPPSAPTLSVNNALLAPCETSSTVVFTSTNAGNAVSGNYQWSFNNGSGPVPLSDSPPALPDGATITGSSTFAMTISGATGAEAGSYTVTGGNTDPTTGTVQTGSASGTLTFAQPTLNIVYTGSSLVLSWLSSTPSCFILKQTGSLAQPIAWSPVSGGTSGVSGGYNTYTITPAPLVPMYYELKTAP